MMTETKAFDCVAMRVEGATRICRRIAGMSREEELAYWKRREGQIEAWRQARYQGLDVPFPDDELEPDAAGTA
jgi:hypothetical protein